MFNYKKLKTMRELHNLKQEDLAKEFDISVSNISKYENGKLDPGTDILSKYTNYFKVDIKYFYDDLDQSIEDLVRQNLINEIKSILKQYDSLEIEALMSILKGGLSLVDLRNMLVRLSKFEEDSHKKSK